MGIIYESEKFGSRFSRNAVTASTLAGPPRKLRSALFSAMFAAFMALMCGALINAFVCSSYANGRLASLSASCITLSRNPSSGNTAKARPLALHSLALSHPAPSKKSAAA